LTTCRLRLCVRPYLALPGARPYSALYIRWRCTAVGRRTVREEEGEGTHGALLPSFPLHELDSAGEGGPTSRDVGVVQGVWRVGCEVRDAGCGRDECGPRAGGPVPFLFSPCRCGVSGVRGALMGCGAWGVWTARGRQCTGRSLVHTCVTAPAPAADARCGGTHSTPSHPRFRAHHQAPPRARRPE
jgi:hypothetical protein